MAPFRLARYSSSWSSCSSRSKPFDIVAVSLLTSLPVTLAWYIRMLDRHFEFDLIATSTKGGTKGGLMHYIPAPALCYSTCLIIFCGPEVLRHAEMTPDNRKKAGFSHLFFLFFPTWQVNGSNIPVKKKMTENFIIKRPQFIFQIFLFPFWAWLILPP